MLHNRLNNIEKALNQIQAQGDEDAPYREFQRQFEQESPLGRQIIDELSPAVGSRDARKIMLFNWPQRDRVAQLGRELGRWARTHLYQMPGAKVIKTRGPKSQGDFIAAPQVSGNPFLQIFYC